MLTNDAVFFSVASQGPGAGGESRTEMKVADSEKEEEETEDFKDSSTEMTVGHSEREEEEKDGVNGEQAPGKEIFCQHSTRCY